MSHSIAINLTGFLAFTFLTLFFLILLVRNIGVVLRSVGGVHKTSAEIINPSNVPVLIAKSLFDVRFFFHTVTLAVLVISSAYATSFFFDYSFILTIARAELQGVDVAKCLSYPPEIWHHIEKCL